jgi:hypothetical protein
LEHLGNVVFLAFDVEDFTAQRQDGLDTTIATSFGRTACGITLYEVNFALAWIA